MSAREKSLEVNPARRVVRGEALNLRGGVDHKLTYLEATVRRAGSEIK